MTFAERQRQALENILGILRQQVEGLEDVACLHRDGTVLVHMYVHDHPQQTIALLLEYSQMLEHLTQILDHSEALETFCQGEKRILALYHIKAQWMLGIIGQTANLGLLQRACRQAVGKLRAFFDAIMPDTSA